MNNQIFVGIALAASTVPSTSQPVATQILRIQQSYGFDSRSRSPS